MKINIIDVCWTLYKSNTTFDFISFVMEKKQRKKYRILNIYIIKSLLVLIGKLLKYDIYRYLYISLLKGFSKIQLEQLANDFYNQVLTNIKIDFSFSLVSTLPKDEEKILCSASLDIIIKEVAVQLGINQYDSSILEFDQNDICTGKLSKDILYKKHILFENKKINYVITDNKSDYDLLKKAERPIILSTKNNMAYWKKKNMKVTYTY